MPYAGVAMGVAIFLRGVAGVAPLVLHLIYIYIATPDAYHTTFGGMAEKGGNRGIWHDMRAYRGIYGTLQGGTWENGW